MKAARAADQSWPDETYCLSRLRSPPLKRSPALGGTSYRVEFEAVLNIDHTECGSATQRLCRRAVLP
jgi:hypothetical protein